MTRLVEVCNEVRNVKRGRSLFGGLDVLSSDNSGNWSFRSILLLSVTNNGQAGWGGGGIWGNSVFSDRLTMGLSKLLMVR
mmetsp:Transcript_4959/g.7259  ORF Transcript_4959/g.7259 Transcript_4959/m.7259 type:complete len:80 (-) Transcript_4959:41-280(-)